jgi:hypothetical protein
VLVIMWRGWFPRNDVIFGKGRETIVGSAKFLTSYSGTLNGLSKRGKREADDKGKATMHGEPNEAQTRRGTMEGTRIQVKWAPSMQGWVKLNVDAAFCWESGKANVGSVVRDHAGNVVLTAWRGIRRCGSLEIAEAEACVQGLKLVAEWVKESTVVESD